MAESHVTFHVPQEGSPENLIPLLVAIDAENARFSSVAALLDFARAQGLSTRTEMHILAATCGLLDKTPDGFIALSRAAHAIVQARPEVRADLVHYLLYTGWQADTPGTGTLLWSYREVTDTLWRKAPIDLGGLGNVIAEEIRNRIQEVFGYDPSFGPKSIRGVRKWLEALRPPVLDAGIFSRRYFCAPELTLLASGWVFKRTAGEPGTEFLLTPERREAICRLCVLDLAALDRVLDWMLPLYPAIVQPGTRAGVYGRFLRFDRHPDVSDVIGVA